MLRQSRTMVVMLSVVISATLVAAQRGASQKQRHAKQTRVSQTKPAPATPAPPPPPAFPADLPPVAPNVTYNNGLLAIDAPNSSLSDVMAAVRRATGASIEGAGQDRIVVHLGPGKPRDVISALLQGSRYDYIILGPKGDPTGVQKVMLMARAGGGEGAAPQNLPATPVANPQEQQSGRLNPDEDEDVADRDNEEMSPKGEVPPEQQGPPQQNPYQPPQPNQLQPQQPQAQPQQIQPVQPNQQQQQAPGQPPIAPQADQQQEQQQNNPQVKTPEQLFKELQQMQQQRNQQQQQQQK